MTMLPRPSWAAKKDGRLSIGMVETLTLGSSQGGADDDGVASRPEATTPLGTSSDGDEPRPEAHFGRLTGRLGRQQATAWPRHGHDAPLMAEACPKNGVGKLRSIAELEAGTRMRAILGRGRDMSVSVDPAEGAIVVDATRSDSAYVHLRVQVRPTDGRGGHGGKVRRKVDTSLVTRVLAQASLSSMTPASSSTASYMHSLEAFFSSFHPELFSKPLPSHDVASL
ncbi:hypothetical protein RJ55_05561 [Drechmeria coniospora]|nr:hypothetical protein RJ55_05561 [Drechmeria coniospora]